MVVVAADVAVVVFVVAVAGSRAGNRYACPNGIVRHVFCAKCLKYAFAVEESEFKDGSKRFSCPICDM